MIKKALDNNQKPQTIGKRTVSKGVKRRANTRLAQKSKIQTDLYSQRNIGSHSGKNANSDSSFQQKRYSMPNPANIN